MIYFVIYDDKIIYSQKEEGEFVEATNNIKVIEQNLKFRAHDFNKLDISKMKVIKTKNIYPEDIYKYLNTINPSNYSFDKNLYRELKDKQIKEDDADSSNINTLQNKIKDLEEKLASEKSANQASLIGLKVIK